MDGTERKITKIAREVSKFTVPKAEQLKNSKAHIEALFYEWLLAELPEEEKKSFSETLGKLYLRSKKESRTGFLNVSRLVEEQEDKNVEAGTAE